MQEDRKYVILCVDDDPEILDWMQTVLQRGGYEVAAAANAEAGLKEFKERRPDLVIVDLMMEEIDAGASLVTKIRALGAKTPVYMLSSTGDDLNRSIDYAVLGLDGVFQKPVDPVFLLRVLKEKLK